MQFGKEDGMEGLSDPKTAQATYEKIKVRLSLSTKSRIVVWPAATAQSTCSISARLSPSRYVCFQPSEPPAK